MNKDKQNKECCCVSYERGVYPCLCNCHTQAPQEKPSISEVHEPYAKAIKATLSEIMNNPRTFDEPNALAQKKGCNRCGDTIADGFNVCGNCMALFHIAESKKEAQKKCNHQTCKEEGEYCLWERMKVDQKKECCENYPICECHTKAPQEKDTSWDERFDKLCSLDIDEGGWNIWPEGCDMNKVKDFITKEIQKAKEDTIKELIEKIDKHYLEYCRKYNGRTECKNCGLDKEDLKTLLTKE